MKHLTLIRSYLKDCTVGEMAGLATLERPWQDNAPNVSCIPEGDYVVKRDTTGRFQWFAVQDVPNRTFIEFHEGTNVKDSAGCILVSKLRVGAERLMWDEFEALNELVREHPKGFTLTIRQFNPATDKWSV